MELTHQKHHCDLVSCYPPLNRHTHWYSGEVSLTTPFLLLVFMDKRESPHNGINGSRRGNVEGEEHKSGDYGNEKGSLEILDHYLKIESKDRS